MKIKFLILGLVSVLFFQCKNKPVVTLDPDDVNLPVRINGQWGFINQSGNYIIYPKFEEVMPFSDGTAAVFLNGQWGYIDTTGRYLIQPEYDEVTVFSEEKAYYADEDENFNCIDKKNKLLFTLKNAQICRVFKDGLSAVCVDGLWGFVDEKGKPAIEPRYAKVSDFDGGIAKVVSKEGNELFINTKGEAQSRHKEAGKKEELTFVGGLALKRDQSGKYGYVNEKGNFVIKPVYELAGDFKNEIAFVKIDGKIGFINRKGDLVIEPRYENSYESCVPVVSLSKDILQVKEFVKKFLANSTASTFKGFSKRKSVKQILAMGNVQHKGQALYVKNNLRLAPYATLIETYFYFNEDVMNINKNVKFNYQDGFNLADSVFTEYNEDVLLNGIEYVIAVSPEHADQIPKIIKSFRHEIGGIMSGVPVYQHHDVLIDNGKMRVRIMAPLSKENPAIRIRADFLK